MLLEHAHTFYSGHGGPFSRKRNFEACLGTGDDKL